MRQDPHPYQLPPSAPALLGPLLKVERGLAWWEPTPLGLVIYIASVSVAIWMFRRAAALRRRRRAAATQSVVRRSTRVAP